MLRNIWSAATASEASASIIAASRQLLISLLTVVFYTASMGNINQYGLWMPYLTHAQVGFRFPQAVQKHACR